MHCPAHESLPAEASGPVLERGGKAKRRPRSGCPAASSNSIRFVAPAQVSILKVGAALLGLALMAVGVLLRPASAGAQTSEQARVQSAPVSSPAPDRERMEARIREEGLKRSHVMETLGYLTEGIGPRLTGSPNFQRAAEWARDRFLQWGLTNSHLEPWGPFGRGWSLQRFSAQVTAPQVIPLIAQPRAWSPGLARPVEQEVVWLKARTEAELEPFRGRLQGAIVLLGQARELKPSYEPPVRRLAESNLFLLASVTNSRSFNGARSGAASNATATATAGASTNPPAARTISSADRLAFATLEGAALIVAGSGQGEAGTLFLTAASVPGAFKWTDPALSGATRSAATNTPAVSPSPRTSRSPWATNAAPYPPQIVVATEDYNRLVRMIDRGEKPRLQVDLEVKFHDASLMSCNVLAEIAGSDRAQEVVMLGAHLDSWHAGTGATDNGAGVAAVMEAARILQAIGARPRRTIRFALWGGEEQGLLGSKAYVSRHFGYYTNLTNSLILRGTNALRIRETARATGSAGSKEAEDVAKPVRQLVRHVDHDRLSVYFNLDNGAGRVRGVYLQGNENARGLFREWLRPFQDLGAETITLSDTGGTDHLSFDAVGLPGFQFIQDPLDYGTRTHHSNMDVLDRVIPEDLRQVSVVLAMCAYEAASAQSLVPRKDSAGPAGGRARRP